MIMEFNMDRMGLEGHTKSKAGKRLCHSCRNMDVWEGVAMDSLKFGSGPDHGIHLTQSTIGNKLYVASPTIRQTMLRNNITSS
jgi:hypothetical protein